MNYNWLELAIIAFIIGTIGVVIWKGGSANPEGTGSLGRKVNVLDRDVRKLGGDFEDIERRLGEIERTTAKASDIKRIERQMAEQTGKLDKLGEIAAAGQESAKLRGQQLDMLYQTIVEKGMK